MKNYINAISSKYLIAILLMLTNHGCNTHKDIGSSNTDQTVTIEECNKVIALQDSIIIANSLYMQRQDSIISVIRNSPPTIDVKKVNELNKRIDSLKVANNKLGKELLHNKLIIKNAKYYLDIVNKNPTQQKFLRGWMNRALNQ